MTSLPMMSAEEFERCEIVADEAGFGAMQTDAGNLPLQELKVDAEVNALLSRVTLRQVFVNNYDRPLEATYIFPLPNRAAVVDFKMVVNGRVIDGVLKERGEARREYREAIEAGHRASIVEEDRPDVFTMRVGNIAPGERATIELSMTSPLIFAEGEATFRFPLVVAPRYIPGKPLDGASVGDGTAPDTDAVPDASRITPPVMLPGFESPVQLGITVAIDHRAIEVKNVRSSLHAITSEREGGRTVVRIEPGERVNRDFILRFDVGQDDVSSALTLVPDEAGDEGTYFVTLIPPTIEADARRARDVVFVLDRSGSMGGWKMVAARRALGRMVDTLSPNDRFGLIAFDTSVEFPKFTGRALIEATNRNRYRAIEWLSSVDARGGTEMAEPIFDALDIVKRGDAGRDRVVILVTDGQVGNERQLIKGVSQRMKDARIFTVGIDQAVNAGFLERLAKIGNGRCELVESEDRLDDVMDRLHRTIDTPLVTEISVNLVGATKLPGTMTPERPATLFAASPLVISGRYKAAEPTVRAEARGALSVGTNWRCDLDGKTSSTREFASIWAKTRLREMEDAYTIMETSHRHGRDELRKGIIETSLKFNVLCRFTSFVAVDRSEKVDGDLHQVTQPVEAPQGWDMLNAPKAMSASAAPRMLGKMRKKGAPAPAAHAPLRAMAPPPSMAQSAFGGAPGGGGFGGFDDEADAAMELSLSEAPSEPILAQSMAYSDAASFEEEGSVRSKSKEERFTSRGRTRPVAGFGDDIRHLSPEAARGDDTTPAHDVFVLALYLYELVTGRPLFSGASDVAVLSAIIGWNPSALKADASELGALLPLMERALAVHPGDRYADVKAFAADLTRLVGSGSAPTFPSSPVQATTLPETLGGYTVEGNLYEGAHVTIARASSANAEVVIRFIPHDVIAAGDQAWAEAYLDDREAPNACVARTLASGKTPQGDYWVAYDVDAAVSLATILVDAQRSPMALDDAVSIAHDVAQAIAPLHEAGEAAGWMAATDFVVSASGRVRALGIGPAAAPSASTTDTRPSVFQRIRSFFSGDGNVTEDTGGRRDEFWK